MAFWKKKKKGEESGDSAQKEISANTSADTVTPSGEAAVKAPPAVEQPKEAVVEKLPEAPARKTAREKATGGVFFYGKRISGFFGKGFWGILSILILPPVFIFAFGLLFIVCMLVFPLLAVVLVALVPVVFVTLAIFLIAIPVVFPLLVLFLLITGKGRLLIGTEGKWLGLEMFGKNFFLK